MEQCELLGAEQLRTYHIEKLTADGSHIFIVKKKFFFLNQTTRIPIRAVESKLSVNHMACLLIHLTC